MSQAPPIQDPFVGREIEQQRYQQFLTKVSPWVMNIIGQGGIGKSTLLRHLSELTPPEALVGSLKGLRRCKLTERSEEHTSELQSHLNLVCRLLLEKKK